MYKLCRVALALLCLTSLVTTSAANAAASPGQAAYAANCASCHGVKLGGAFGPPLSGKAFKDKWAPQGAAAMLKLISESMPPSKPGGLDAATYAELTNLVLAKNRMPSLGKSAAPARAKPAPAREGGAAEAGGNGEPVTNDDPQSHAAKAARAAVLASMAPVTEAMLRNPSPDDWLNWRRTDDGFGFSPLKQINAGNANHLEVAWTLSLPAAL